MIFDELGLPRVSGASDKQDSSMLAGMMTVFEWPQKVDLNHYVIDEWSLEEKRLKIYYVRHPLERIYDFSRDQAIPLMAGLSKQGPIGCIYPHFITGKDFLSPSDYGFIERCKSRKASFFQDAWFWMELAFSAYVKPMDELNQLFCKMMIADVKFMKWYCKANPKWQQSLKDYWCENAGVWRNEPELCWHIIAKIEERIK